MNKTFQSKQLSGSMDFLNTLKNHSTKQSAADQCLDTTLRLNLHGYSVLHGSHGNGNKRKSSDVEDAEEGFSLDLGLGGSSSSSNKSKLSSASAFTISSAKESDEGSSMELDLNYQPHLSQHGVRNPKKPTISVIKTLETGPACNLQLSLSAGPSASVITTASPLSVQNWSNLEMSVSVNGVTSADEGSTSSRWKSGVSLLPPFNANKPLNNFTLRWPDATGNDLIPSVMNQLPTTTEVPKSSVTCISGITHQQRNTSTRTCQFQGCVKGSRGASGLCIAHGGGKRCQRQGCHKGAEGRTLYCKAHGGGRRCQSADCTKSAEGRTNFCIAHGGGRRCSYERCTRAARGKSGLCIRHGGGKRCQRENCTKSAEGYSGLCISHGGGRRCQFPACTKGAQGSTMFCKAHGGGKRCTALGCTKGAEGSTPFCKGHGGGKRCSFQGGGICPKSVHGGTLFCVAHGGGKRCAAPECTKSARGRTDFCVRHGGGKRCRSEGCGKSAQGRTDFCKAHGGGKRCSWGQSGSTLGSEESPCDRFARGKSGLCTAHSSLFQDRAVHRGLSLAPAAIQHTHLEEPGKTVSAFTDTRKHGWNFVAPTVSDTRKHGWNFVAPTVSEPRVVHQVSPVLSSKIHLPEGRVHGGSLMALLASGADVGNNNLDLAGVGCSEKVAAGPMPRRWM